MALQSGLRCLPGRGQRKEAWRWASVGGMGGDPRTWEGVISAKSRGGLAGRVICGQEEARTRVWKRMGVAGVQRGS